MLEINNMTYLKILALGCMMFMSGAVSAQTSGVGRFDKAFKLHGLDVVKDTTVVRPDVFYKIDKVVNDAIDMKAFPGCQVFAAKDGKVIFNKSYGYFNYDKKEKVTNETMYDVASITKIVSTTLAIMRLYEKGKLNLKATLDQYLDMVKGTDKAKITVESLLLHQAGFKGWIPFHKNTLDSLTGKPSKALYSSVDTTGFRVPVSANMFIKNLYPRYMLYEMIQSPLVNKGKYVYSDIDLILLEKIVENLTNQTLERYVYDNFYIPLNLSKTMYNPWIIGFEKYCAPTELDMYFRMQHIKGYVHDPVASLMGGVAGHAGIFSTSKEIATIMQMLLNGGSYNGVRYFHKETVALFTSYRSKISRRGYGFDKPEKKGNDGPTSELCSKATFGHTGFTGTCTWADPETGIVFVFLSNRVNPSATNNLLSSTRLRGKIQTYVYEALGYGK